MPVVLDTPRLRLRRFAADDADAVAALAGNWKVASMLGRMPFPYTRTHAVEFLERMALDDESKTDFVFAFTLPGGPAMGAIGLHVRDHGHFELGYWLGEPYWGKGYATEAAERLVQFAFEDLEIDRLIAGHFFDNPASGRVLSKVGFTYTHDDYRDALARGGKVLCHEMQQLRSDWRARRTHGVSSLARILV